MKYLVAALLLFFSSNLLAQGLSFEYGILAGYVTSDAEFDFTDVASFDTDDPGTSVGMFVRYRPFRESVSYQLQVEKNFAEPGLENSVRTIPLPGVNRSIKINKLEQDVAVDLLAIYHFNRFLYLGGGLAVAAFSASGDLTTEVANNNAVVKVSASEDTNHWGVKVVVGVEAIVGIFGQVEYTRYLDQDYDSFSSEITATSYGLKLGYRF